MSAAAAANDPTKDVNMEEDGQEETKEEAKAPPTISNIEEDWKKLKI